MVSELNLVSTLSGSTRPLNITPDERQALIDGIQIYSKIDNTFRNIQNILYDNLQVYEYLLGMVKVGFATTNYQTFGGAYPGKGEFGFIPIDAEIFTSSLQLTSTGATPNDTNNPVYLNVRNVGTSTSPYYVATNFARNISVSGQWIDFFGSPTLPINTGSQGTGNPSSFTWLRDRVQIAITGYLEKSPYPKFSRQQWVIQASNARQFIQRFNYIDVGDYYYADANPKVLININSQFYMQAMPTYTGLSEYMPIGFIFMPADMFYYQN